MIEPNESAVAILRVEIGPVVREDMRVQVDLHARLVRLLAPLKRDTIQPLLQLKRLHRSGLLDLFTALFARPARVVVPEVEHRLAEVLHDVGAVEVNVFHQCPAIFAVENDVFPFARRTATLDHHAERVWRPLRRVRNIRRDEECFAFAHDVIHNPLAFADPHFDVALQLVEVLFRIDEMKIVPRVRAFDDHHKKIAPVIEITVAHRRLELFSILFDPVVQINRRRHGRRDAAR